MQVGSDDDGDAVRLRFKHYVHYATHPDHAAADDSPLYIFDGSFADKCASMAAEYVVPPFFQEDLMALAGERRRPPYRWLVMGPPRSGSNLHVDPLATSAWNALLTGHKRWAWHHVLIAMPTCFYHIMVATLTGAGGRSSPLAPPAMWCCLGRRASKRRRCPGLRTSTRARSGPTGRQHGPSTSSR